LFIYEWCRGLHCSPCVIRAWSNLSPPLT